MNATLTELLERAGGEPPRSGRGKWWCPKCDGNSPTLSVDVNQELFFCHRCGWSGNAFLLARELGVEVKLPSAPERAQHRIVRREAAQFEEWARQRRIATAALLRDLGRYELQWRETGRQQLGAGEPVSELVWRKLQSLAAWEELAAVRYEKLCEMERYGAELYSEFSRDRKAA